MSTSTNTCALHDSGTIELYFYDELPADERADIASHVRRCRACAEALAELALIRTALTTRPDVAAPPSGDWSAFMTRLDLAVARVDREGAGVVVAFEARPPVARRPYVGLLATAALVAIVAVSVFFASQAGRQAVQPSAEPAASQAADGGADAGTISEGLASAGAGHVERSKLVVLGLASKPGDGAASADWAYERALATSLLNDTRMYRLAAEQRGLASLAGIMRDLELVLLQTSMAQPTDDSALPQIQRLIRKRGLVEKMNVVGTTGLLP